MLPLDQRPLICDTDEKILCTSPSGQPLPWQALSPVTVNAMCQKKALKKEINEMELLNLLFKKISRCTIMFSIVPEIVLMSLFSCFCSKIYRKDNVHLYLFYANYTEVGVNQNGKDITD